MISEETLRSRLQIKIKFCGFDQCLSLALVYIDRPTDKSGRFKDLKGNSGSVALHSKVKHGQPTLPIMQLSHVYFVPGKHYRLSNCAILVCNTGVLIKT